LGMSRGKRAHNDVYRMVTWDHEKPENSPDAQQQPP
jgi:hypothetical protein